MVLVTGGSSGIGLAAAIKFAEAGAITSSAAVTRTSSTPPSPRSRPTRPARTRQIHAYACDIADEAGAAGRVAWCDSEFGGVDFLINNAGRSIRRAIESSYDRFHDFERTMQLNYFGCLRVTMGLLPGMVAEAQGPRGQHQLHRRADQRAALQRLRGQQGRARRLDALRLQRVCRPGHHLHHHQHALVRTPMIAPTKIYNNVPTLSPEEAADMIAQACTAKPVRIATRLGQFGELLHAVARASPRS